MRAMEAALEEANHDGLARAAHRLEGASSNLEASARQPTASRQRIPPILWLAYPARDAC